MTDSKSIFLVDDDPINNMINKQLIARTDDTWRCRDFLSAREGLDVLREKLQNGENSPPDIIFLDINMPVMNGWDFLDEYIQMPENFREQCRLYILSSSIDRQDIRKARSYADVHDYLTKPLSHQVLRTVLSGESLMPEQQR